MCVAHSGHVKEADAHYGAQPWMMHVAADGETMYIKNNIPDAWIEDAEAQRKAAEDLIPAGAPISQGDTPASEDGSTPAFTWYKYADNSVKHEMANGDIQITYDSGKIARYCEYS